MANRDFISTVAEATIINRLQEGGTSKDLTKQQWKMCEWAIRGLQHKYPLTFHTFTTEVYCQIRSSLNV